MRSLASNLSLSEEKRIGLVRLEVRLARSRNFIRGDLYSFGEGACDSYSYSNLGRARSLLRSVREVAVWGVQSATEKYLNLREGRKIVNKPNLNTF